MNESLVFGLCCLAFGTGVALGAFLENRIWKLGNGQ